MQHNIKREIQLKVNWLFLVEFVFSPSIVDEEAVRPEEEAAGDICRGGGAGHGRTDEGVVPAAGPTDLPH